MSSKSTKIYVGNIPDSCKVEELRALFHKFGRVEECDIVKNFGFVHMSSDDETKTAIEALNGTEFMGTKISVEASHSKVRPKPGMGGKGQCYRCGKSGHWSKECPRNSHERSRGLFGYSHHYSDRYNRFGPTRSHSTNRYERSLYVRPYIHPYERIHYGDPYERRLLPPDDYYRRPFPPYEDYIYERRIRDRYNDYYEDRPYPYYCSSSRREAIY